MAHPGTTAPDQINRTEQTAPAAPDDRPADDAASQRTRHHVRGVRVP